MNDKKQWLKSIELSKHQGFLDLLTFEKPISWPIHLATYWAGLGIIILFGFLLLGAVVGIILRGDGWEKFLAVPAFVFGTLLVAIMALIWRGAAEGYMAILTIAKSLNECKNTRP